jgi:hypothetical protein
MVAVQGFSFSFQVDSDKEWTVGERNMELCIVIDF